MQYKPSCCLNVDIRLCLYQKWVDVGLVMVYWVNAHDQTLLHAWKFIAVALIIQLILQLKILCIPKSSCIF